MLKSIITVLLLTVSAASFAQQKQTQHIDLTSLSKSSWTEQERENARIITDFVQHQ